jgi:Spy/CpxP family protein refolding chaperone
MQIQQKIALIALAAAISIPAALAQAQDQGSAPQPPPPGPGMIHRQMSKRGWSQRDGERPGRGEWSRDGMRDRDMRGRGMRGMNRWGRQDLMLARIVKNSAMRERLGITADQAAKIEQETLDFRKTQIQDRANTEVKRVELASLLSADQPDRAAIDKELDEMSVARLAQAKAAIDFHLKMRDALTPDQRQKLEQMRGNFRGGHVGGPRGMRRQGGSQGGPPPASSSPDEN